MIHQTVDVITGIDTEIMNNYLKTLFVMNDLN